MNIENKDFEVYERLRQDDELNTFRPTDCGLAFDKVTYISKNYTAIRQDYMIHHMTGDEVDQLCNLEQRVEPAIITPVVVAPQVMPVVEPLVIREVIAVKSSIKQRYDQALQLIIDGKSNKEITEIMSVSNTYVYKIRKQYEAKQNE